MGRTIVVKVKVEPKENTIANDVEPDPLGFDEDFAEAEGDPKFEQTEPKFETETKANVPLKTDTTDTEIRDPNIRTGDSRLKYKTWEELRLARNERRRKRRAQMSFEEREKYLRKIREAYYKRTKADYDEEELEKRWEEKMKFKEMKLTMTREELAEITRKRRLEYARRKKARRKQTMTKEEKETKKALEAVKRFEKKLRMTEEDMEKWRFYRMCAAQEKYSKMTDDERDVFRKQQRERAKEWRKNLKGEKLEEYKEYMRNHYRMKLEKETPEQKQRRLRNGRISFAVNRLRKQLREKGLPEEEIKERCEELRKVKEASDPLTPNITPEPKRKRGRTFAFLKMPPRSESVTTVTATIQNSTSCGTSQQLEEESNCTTGSVRASDNDNSFSFHEVDDHSFDGEISSNHNDSSLQIAVSSPSTTPASNSSVRNDNNERRVVEREESPTLQEAVVISNFQFDGKCPHCPSIFHDRDQLTNHISTEHVDSCWKCPLCKSVMLNPTELQEHFRSKHKPKNSIPRTSPVTTTSSKSKYDCIKCDPSMSLSNKGFKSMEDLMEHFKSTHPQSYWPCTKCNILKYTENSLKVHAKVCHSK